MLIDDIFHVNALDKREGRSCKQNKGKISRDRSRMSHSVGQSLFVTLCEGGTLLLSAILSVQAANKEVLLLVLAFRLGVRIGISQ